MFGLGIPELLVILAIVLLIFGPKRLKNIGSDLGNAIKGFRKAVSDDDAAPSPQNQAEQERVIEGETEPQTDSARANAQQDSR
ncbi:MAG: twin-arginine translocase TatA/TatE family subunit [Pseudomonadota bacterium]